jgi:hypothetical protein
VPGAGYRRLCSSYTARNFPFLYLFYSWSAATVAAAEYADRKNDEEEEYVADSLLYDRTHLPRTAPAPDCVTRPAAAAGGAVAAAGVAAAAAAQP